VLFSISSNDGTEGMVRSGVLMSGVGGSSGVVTVIGGSSGGVTIGGSGVVTDFFKLVMISRRRMKERAVLVFVRDTINAGIDPFGSNRANLVHWQVLSDRGTAMKAEVATAQTTEEAGEGGALG